MAVEVTRTKTFRGGDLEASADRWLKEHEEQGWTVAEYNATHTRGGLKVEAVFKRRTATAG